MGSQRRGFVTRGSKKRVKQIRLRDHWSWRMTVAVSIFLLVLIWMLVRLASVPPAH